MQTKWWEAPLALLVLFVIMNFSDLNPLLGWDAYRDTLNGLFHWIGPGAYFVLLLATIGTAQWLSMRADRRKDATTVLA